MGSPLPAASLCFLPKRGFLLWTCSEDAPEGKGPRDVSSITLT